MNAIRDYILSLLCVSIVCALLRCLIDEKSSSGKIIKMLCGIILAVTAISPLIQVKISDLDYYFENISIQSKILIQKGEDSSSREMAAIISEKTEAYILEKASVYDCSLNIDVILTKDAIPQPVAVDITGTVSPYVRSKLMQIIETDLGIPKESQQWTYQN